MATSTKNSTIEKLGNYSNASVLKHTGKSWRQWVEVLNKTGAAHLTHKEIVALLKTKHRLSMWWQQGVASGYEIHIGRRVQGQDHKGEYTVTSTKTLSVDQKLTWKIMTSPEGQNIWLAPLTPFVFKPKVAFEVRGGIFGAVRTMKAPERARLSWQDTDWIKATVISLNIVSKPGKKCIVALSHSGLKDARLKEKMREHWRKALDALAAHVKSL